MVNNIEVKELLQKLIKIESPYFKEEEAVKFSYEWLKSNGLPAELHHYEDKVMTNFKGINAIGELKGGKPGPTILLNGHIDTVDLCNGWTKDPYAAQVEDGLMYGLGALDMKSGVAAMMVAIKQFKENYPEFSGNIKYHIVSDEEGPYGLGTNALIEDNLCEADVAIIPEPTSGFLGYETPTVCLGARGGVSYTVNIKGISAHAASPERGVNAIVETSKIIVELKKLQTIKDEKLGYGSTAIIRMEGGDAPASIADRASFNVFRHMVRGENKKTVEDEVLLAAKNADVSLDNVELIFRDAPSEGSEAFLPYVCSEEDPYIKAFLEITEQTIKQKAKIDYFPSIGDFCYIGSRVNIPTIVFGPAGKNFHSSDEHVVLQSVYDTSNSIYNYFVEILTK